MRYLFFVGYIGLLMLLAFKGPFLFPLLYSYRSEERRVGKEC